MAKTDRHAALSMFMPVLLPPSPHIRGPMRFCWSPEALSRLYLFLASYDNISEILITFFIIRCEINITPPNLEFFFAKEITYQNIILCHISLQQLLTGFEVLFSFSFLFRALLWYTCFMLNLLGRIKCNVEMYSKVESRICCYIDTDRLKNSLLPTVTKSWTTVKNEMVSPVTNIMKYNTRYLQGNAVF